MEPVAPSMAQDETLYPTLRALDLRSLEGAERFRRLDRLEQYYRCTQYESREYNWDGSRRGYEGGQADIAPGWFVPLRRRRPNVRADMPRLITQRLSAMVFGAERMPQIVVDGDEDAQDYVRELAREASLGVRLQELRDKGGSQGTACCSFGFVDGKPRITVHNAKHMTVLRWADRHEFRPAEVLEAYSYPRVVYDEKTGKMRELTFWHARYWTERVEMVWSPIPEQLAVQGRWVGLPSTMVEHGLGFCPVYWAQNFPDSDGVDGDSDYEGMLDRVDEMSVLLSATGKGTVANVDPTLVIRAEPELNTGPVRTGKDGVIWSPGGAEYLELRGDSLRAALELLKTHRQEVLDSTGVVLGDPALAAKAQSAAALRIMYLPMINTADRLREQYGKLVMQLLRDMLRAARAIAARAPGPVLLTPDGLRIQMMPTVLLDARVMDGVSTPRMPGTSEKVTINWPPYFPNSWGDIKNAIDSLSAGSGGKPIFSRRTAVENVAPLVGIADVDQELSAMDEDRATDVAFAQQAFAEQERAADGPQEESFVAPREEPEE